LGDKGINFCRAKATLLRLPFGLAHNLTIGTELGVEIKGLVRGVGLDHQ